MTYRALPCFKAYDIRGRIGVELDGDVAYRVGRNERRARRSASAGVQRSLRSK